jgi:glycosyltransferase involved in cell wall biosynthesis
MCSLAHKPTVTFLLGRLHCNDGIASSVELLAECLSAHGYRTTLAVGEVFAIGGSVARLERLKRLMERWTVEPSLLRLRLSRPWTLFTQANRLAQICAEHKSSIVHLNGRGLGPACWLSERRTGVQYVNTMQLALSDGERLGFFARTFLGRTLGDRYIAISRETAVQATQCLGVPASRVRLIYHGYDPRFQIPTPLQRAQARAELGLREDQFVCAVIARLSPIKRHDVAVEAARILRDEGREVIVLFAGEGEPEYRQRLAALVTSFGLGDHIRFLGHVDPLPVLWASDVNILASEREGFPIVVPEAMAAGAIPIRTPAEGAADQIENGKTGFIFPHGDAVSLAKCLRHLTENPGELRCVSARAAEMARQRFSAEVMVAKTIAVYRELLQGDFPLQETLVTKLAAFH